MREILNDIRQDGWRAGEVMRRLRLLLKKGEVQLQPLDVNEVERNALNLMRSDLVNQNVALYTEFAPHLPAVNGDDVQLQQVLLNLVVNGCDAMASVEAVGRRLLVRTELADGEKVRVSVVDQGCGTPPEKSERIFEPFFTTKRHGMGLGLGVCLSIISAHGGRLWVLVCKLSGVLFCILFGVMRRENMCPSRQQSQRGHRLSSPKSSRDERRTAPFPRSRRWNICQIPCKLSRQISSKLTRYEFQFVFQQFHDARRVLLLHLL